MEVMQAACQWHEAGKVLKLLTNAVEASHGTSDIWRTIVRKISLAQTLSTSTGVVCRALVGR
jgi:hypothetical protein